MSGRLTQEDRNLIREIDREIRPHRELKPIPDNGLFKPRVWQIRDLEHLIQEERSANWSEMGCFKTSTGIWLLEQKLSDVKNPRVLVVTTRSGKGTYFKHVPVMMPDWGLYNITSNHVGKIMFDDEMFKWTHEEFPKSNKWPFFGVAHYNVFANRSKMLDNLLDSRWDAVILDEAHRIKNPNAQWSVNLHKLKAPIRHIMTGTGFINNPAEIWSLLHFLDRKQFSSFWAFHKEYCLTFEQDGHAKVIGINPGKKVEFRQLVRSFGPRRTKVEVFRNLAKPIFTAVPVDLNPTQRKMYDQIKTELRAMDQQGVPVYAANVLVALNRLRQICVATPNVVREWYDEEAERTRQEISLIEPSSKLDAVMEILEGLEWDDERKDQVVIFSNFKDPLELLKKRLDARGITYLHLQEKDNDRVRYEKWGVTFPKKEHQIFMSTLQLGSESISLTSASTCIFLDRSWSPKDNEQGVSRVWRPGQENVANIINIEARRTTDQRVLATNTRKMGWFNEIFGEDDDADLDNREVEWIVPPKKTIVLPTIYRNGRYVSAGAKVIT